MTSVEKTGIYTTLFVIIALLGLIVFSKNGVLDYRMLKQKEQTILDQVRSVENTNQKLETEIKSLKTDLDYLKHLAKHEHDMAEDDELIFKDNSEKKGNTP